LADFHFVAELAPESNVAIAGEKSNRFQEGSSLKRFVTRAAKACKFPLTLAPIYAIFD